MKQIIFPLELLDELRVLADKLEQDPRQEILDFCDFGENPDYWHLRKIRLQELGKKLYLLTLYLEFYNHAQFDLDATCQWEDGERRELLQQRQLSFKNEPF